MEGFHKNIHIENFKSINNLSIDLDRVNLFIGNPSSGKSNIIEAIRLLSQNGIDRNSFWSDYRIEDITNLFRNNNILNTIKISTNHNYAEFRAGTNQNGMNLNYIESTLKDFNEVNGTSKYRFEYNKRIEDNGGNEDKGTSTNLKFYNFNPSTEFQSSFMPFLVSPDGSNLPDILQRNLEFKEIFKSLLASEGYRYVIEPNEKKVKILKEENEELILTPYQSYSDTFRRFVFLLAAIESNDGVSLLFDEPEANMFPFYIKSFAEALAINNKNQYLITTHSPYLINSVISKVKFSNLTVNLVYKERYETRVIRLNKEQIGKLVEWDIDIPYNIDSFLEDK